jgi:hypothetical protein
MQFAPSKGIRKLASQDRPVLGSEFTQALEKKVWEYDELVAYKEVDSKREVAVP